MTFRDLSSMMKNAKSGRKKRSVTRKRVASPDLCGVMVQKGGPPLYSWLRSANLPHVFLDGSLAHMNAEFQEFPMNPLSTPEPILRRHFSDQCDGFRSYPGLVRRGL